ncbi:threonine/serine exporter family protein [Treponema parvum]|uniref:Threonine/serine exporter family protein n=1 Tax=Treponema parvum TaxID=138851 RepID=A0A975EZK9_9SPIR|nr:threonine/serine exporter family protein [Treponema parvum]QTQ11319.1 threonine/serine exporter family protein [Treponema parvum]
MSKIVSDDIQDLAVEAGALVLENGGETYRAEETVVRVAKSLGAKNPYSFVTPTVILFSWKNASGEHFMNMKRIRRRCTNLKKLALVNDLSRSIESHGKNETHESLRLKFDGIENASSYPTLILILAAAISSSFFAFMFGGTAKDAVAVFFTGFFLRLMLIFFERRIPNDFLLSVLSGIFIAIVVRIFAYFISDLNVGISMISALMIVVPGITLVTSIRDMIAGDLMAGSARLVEAIIIASGLSIGAAGGLLMAGLV